MDDAEYASIGHIHALEFKLDEIFQEGLEARYVVTHARMRSCTIGCAVRDSIFCRGRVRTKTLTCVKNNKGIDVLDFARRLREKHHLVIDPGYGKIRGKLFACRTWETRQGKLFSHLLACLDDVL